MNTHSTTTTTRKRTHLKPSQVVILQDSFNNNPLPDSSVRSRLARELDVTERTIQIWFQNRRAKARKIEALGSFPTSSSSSNPSLIAPGYMDTNSNRHPTPPRYQATFRTMMTPERFEELKQDNHQLRKRPRSSSKPEPKSSHLLDIVQAHTNVRAMSEGVQHRTNNEAQFPASSANLGQADSAEIPIQMVPLPVSVLRIGSWTRFAHATPQTQQKDWDLVCYGSPIDRELIWRVQAEGHHFRIQVGFDSIHQLRLSQQVQAETGDLVGQLDIELSLPLIFSMWRFGQDHQWVRCGDFTEDKQASVDRSHILQGSHQSFKQALLDLIALAPELASKISVVPNTMMMMDLTQPPPPPLDLCRDFTMSPSATPEPSSLNTTIGTYVPQQMMYHSNVPYGMVNPQQLSKANMSHLMLQAPFFYPSQQLNPAMGNQTNDELYQMMMQQQQQNQPMLFTQPTASSSTSLFS